MTDYLIAYGIFLGCYVAWVLLIAYVPTFLQAYRHEQVRKVLYRDAEKEAARLRDPGVLKQNWR